jgi:hypothetical protein
MALKPLLFDLLCFVFIIFLAEYKKYKVGDRHYRGIAIGNAFLMLLMLLMPLPAGPKFFHSRSGSCWPGRDPGLFFLFFIFYFFKKFKAIKTIAFSYSIFVFIFLFTIDFLHFFLRFFWVFWVQEGLGVSRIVKLFDN